VGARDDGTRSDGEIELMVMCFQSTVQQISLHIRLPGLHCKGRLLHCYGACIRGREKALLGSKLPRNLPNVTQLCNGLQKFRVRHFEAQL